MDRRVAAVGDLERRIGHRFEDRELLERALTHASVGDGAKKVRDNEVLEFIGDRVLGLLAALAWGLKRWGPRGQAGAGGLRIVSALNLGGRERIIVVEVGEQWIVVGASPGRVNALATMPKQRDLAPQAHVVDSGAYAPSAGSFAEWLKQTIDKRK